MSPYYHAGRSLSQYLRWAEVIEVLKRGGFMRFGYRYWAVYDPTGDRYVGVISHTTYNAVMKRIVASKKDGRIYMDLTSR